ncbi:hypothetical protein ACOMHN_054825 [Nucella lapillus]
MGMWLQFRGATSSQLGVYLSNGGHSSRSHGVAILYTNGRLQVIFKMKDGRKWRAETGNVVSGRWYHVAATWSADQGLFLYINGEQKAQDKRPTRVRAVGNSRYNGFYIGRANDNSNLDRLGEVMVDEFMFVAAFKNKSHVREAGAIPGYYLSMDRMQNNNLVQGRFLEGKVFGQASLVDGKVRDGVLLSGDQQYMDLGDVHETCLGDLDLCRYGLYVSVWLKFNRLDRGGQGRKAVLTSPAFALYQDGSDLIAVAKKQRQHWEAESRGGLTAGEWHFVEMSWKPQEGLSLYVNNQRVSFHPSYSNRAPQSLQSMHMYVGRDAARGSTYPSATVDELRIYYADRDTLEDIDFIQTGRPQNYHFNMDTLSRVGDGSIFLSTLGFPRVVPGKVSSALFLDGVRDALDFGNHTDSCFGNLDLCHHGLLLSLWIKPENLKDGVCFLSSGTSGLSIGYDQRKLKVKADTASYSWSISTSDFAANKWYFVEVSFHPEHGLRLYTNSKLVAESDRQPRQKLTPAPANGRTDRFYLGRCNTDHSANTFSSGAFDELDVWYADRDYVISQGYVQRGRPKSFIVHFEEASQDRTHIVHSDLNIRLTGRPQLVPGRVGFALELAGSGRYADLGQQSHTCMGNLAHCKQGITVSAWMRFRSFENNMVFLSTGSSGLLLLFKDGFVLASADGRDQISAPRLETNRWYHVELSWHPNHGLRLFIDNQQVSGNSIPHTYTGTPRRDYSHFYIGKGNYGDVRGASMVTGDFDVDELEIWYKRREDLLAFGYIDRAASLVGSNDLGCEAFDMERFRGDQVLDPKHTLTLKNGASLEQGRDGNALYLNGRGQYLDMGYQMDSCLGNLDLCPHGFTLSVWLRPNALVENMHFIAAPSYFLFYEDRHLSAEFNSRGKSWTVSTTTFRTGEWQRVTLAWHELKGLRMFVDDHLVDTSAGVRRVRDNQQGSGHLYIGRNLVDTRMTADVDVDELQICNDDLDQLRVTGAYQVVVSPVIITFNSLRNGYLALRNRRINAYGNVGLRDGLLPDSRAVYLNGRNQYLDFGNNFTCSGDLETCIRGQTVRLSVFPERLKEGMYLVDSFPVSLYYKNGRLHGEMRTNDQMWTVDTDDFKQGQWSRVEMTWHPTRGLSLYVNGNRMDYQLYPDRRDPSQPRSWKTYLGRPLSVLDGSYANVLVDNAEFYNAHRHFINDDYYLDTLNPYLNDLRRTTPARPVFTPRPVTPRPAFTPGPTTTRRPVTDYPATGAGTTRIIRLTGNAYVNFDFNRLPAHYLINTPNEDLSLMFLTNQPDGLIWFEEQDARTMYIALENGRLVFVNDDKTGSPDKVVLGARENLRFDDYFWHTLEIQKLNRQIKLTVDNKTEEVYTFPDDVQFLQSAKVWLGGTDDTIGRTNGIVRKNFNGGIADVIYTTHRRDGKRTITTTVNLVSQLSRGSTTGDVKIEYINPGGTPTPPRSTPSPEIPPQRRTTSITVVKPNVAFRVPQLSLKSGSSITYNFKTLNQDGLMLFSGKPQGVYFAVELVDGRLYFVHNFGHRDRRTPFSQKIVADGQNHEVEIRFYPYHVDLRVDTVRKRLELDRNQEQMPSDLGSLYVAGVPFNSNSNLPWMVWSREGYVGCLNDLRVGSRLIDFEAQLSALVGSVTRGCIAVSQECTLVRPCAHGQCRNNMISHHCDCSRTPYRGQRCNLDAWTALFNGSIWGELKFTPTLQTHKDDLSVRFRTPARDGLLFETFAKTSNNFLRASMENGRIKVETNLGGTSKRRGNELETWVDDLPHNKATLSGNGYYLNVDRLHLGGKDGLDNRYIGYLQNFHLGSLDILQELRGTPLNVNNLQSLPQLIYYPVTFPDLNSYVSMQPLDKPQSMLLQFMFKTKEPSGILFFTSGSNRGYLIVELFEGNLFIQFSAGGGQPLRATSAQKVNDDRWHTVTIQRVAGDQRQFLLTVDGVTSSVSYAGREGLNLNGEVYIGGVPDEVFQRDYIKNGVFSRTGFRGCLASMDLSGKVTDIGKLAKVQGVTVYDSCRPIISRACTDESCRNFGKCIEVGVNTFRCDCKMSAHSGAVCLDEPLGFRYQNLTRPNKEQPGVLVYSFPIQSTTGSARDEVAFGVMTKQDNAVLLRIFSEIFKDYIEFRLNNGYVEVNYDTDGNGGKHTVTQLKKVNDGKQYHIVRFVRTANNATLHVDDTSVSSKHVSPQGNFDRMSKIYIGGGYDRNGNQIVDGFNGILGGLHINGLLVFPEAKQQVNTRYIGDVVLAPRPFNLTSYGGDTVVLPGPTSTTTPPPVLTTPLGVLPTGPGVVPPGIGGGGVGWTSGPSGVGTDVYPDGSSGTGLLVPGQPPNNPAVAGLAAIPVVTSGPGPRAGAVVGTILALLVLASALMWAFVRCKPGWCTCFKPPPPVAEAVVSAPLLSASNKGAVIAAGGGISGAGGAITGLGDGTGISGSSATVNGGGGGGGMNAFTNYYLSSGSATGGGGGGERFDTATLRATGTFSNKGTAIGTPQPGRAQLGSTATAASVGGYSSNFQESIPMRSLAGSVDRIDGGPVLSPTSLQSYHYEGAGESTTADYDLVTGIHPGYQTNTMSTRGGSVSGGSIGGGGFSSNTMQSMQSSYNYTMRTIGTVSGQQQMVGYADANVVGIPPGALGEEVRVDCCLMNTDGQSVITGSSLGPPQVWDMQSGELLRMMQGETVGSTNLHLACHDTMLVGAINADLEANQYSVPKGVNNYVLQIWDFASGRPMGMPRREACSALTMMNDNEKVVFARTDRLGGSTSVVVWDIPGNQPIKSMSYDAPVGNADFVHFLALSQNNRYVIAGFTNSSDSFAEFIVFDMNLTMSNPAILRLDANPECTAVLPRDEAVTGMRNGDLVIWSMSTGQPSRQLMSGSGSHAHSREVKAVSMSKDNRYLVSASADGTVKAWDMGSERHIHTFNGHTDEVWCCTISSDNEIVVSGSRDRTIRLWKLKDGSPICSFNAGVDIFYVTMSRDKSTIVGLGDKFGARKLVMLQVVRTKVRRQVEDY